MARRRARLTLRKKPKAPRVTWNSNDKWDVEAILEAELQRDKWFYHIKWHGWADRWNSWEPSENLVECQDLVDRFWKGVGGPQGRPRITAESSWVAQEKAITATLPKLRKDGKSTGLTITIPPRTVSAAESNWNYQDVSIQDVNHQEVDYQESLVDEAPPSPTLSDSDSDSSVEFGSDYSGDLQYPASDSDSGDESQGVPEDEDNTRPLSMGEYASDIGKYLESQNSGSESLFLRSALWDADDQLEHGDTPPLAVSELLLDSLWDESGLEQLGGSTLEEILTSQNQWCTKSDYDETGPGSVHHSQY